MRSLVALVLMVLASALGASFARAADLALPNGGRVTMELLRSDAAFRNSLGLVAPGAARVEPAGCLLETAIGLQGVQVLSERPSQGGCRVVLDAAPATPGVQPFPPGTTLELQMCAQADADGDCEFVWSSNPAENSDLFEHVVTTPIEPLVYPGRIFQLAWEDQPSGGDLDFNDLIVVVRVGELDFDGDALWDDWEQYGIDADGNGSIDLDLPALGADPTRKDVFLEVDYMRCQAGSFDCPNPPGHSHRPKDAALALVVAAFASAPVQNPDGSTGITLHVDLDDALPHRQYLALRDNGCGDPVGGIVGSLDDVKADPSFFGADNPRRFAYRYALFGHSKGPDRGTSSGCGELPGNDFLVTLGEWNTLCVGPGSDKVLNSSAGGDDVLITGTGFAGIFTGNNLRCDTTLNPNDAGFTPVSDIDGDAIGDLTVGSVFQQAGTLMHELGHNLGIFHGGGDPVHNKPNYLSVMNYMFQTDGIPRTAPFGLTARLDYSRSSLAALDEVHLDETVGIQGGSSFDRTRFICPSGRVASGAALGAIDWNCDGDGGADPDVGVNVNGQNPIDEDLFGHDDWSALRYDLQNTGAFDDGSSVNTETPEEQPQHLALEVPLFVAIDITPAEAPNAINPRAKGTVPVAILSAPDFDAPAHVATSTVRFGRTGEEASLASCNLRGEDVNGDGLLDLVCHFTRRQTGFAADSTVGTLRGQTLWGKSFEASAPVKVVSP